MNDIATDGYIGRETDTTGGDLFNALSFLVNQVISGKWTVTLGQVNSVSGGGVAAPALVGVQPMVNQTDGSGNPTPHGIINNVPAFRLQGGTGAIIADPVVGDIGLLACAMSDISAVKQNLAPSNPGSFRTFSPSDAMYFGALLGAAPKQYMQITPSAIIISAGTTVVTINFNGTIIINSTALITIESAGGVTLKGSAGVFNVT